MPRSRAFMFADVITLLFDIYVSDMSLRAGCFTRERPPLRCRAPRAFTRVAGCHDTRCMPRRYDKRRASADARGAMLDIMLQRAHERAYTRCAIYAMRAATRYPPRCPAVASSHTIFTLRFEVVDLIWLTSCSARRHAPPRSPSFAAARATAAFHPSFPLYQAKASLISPVFTSRLRAIVFEALYFTPMLFASFSRRHATTCFTFRFFPPADSPPARFRHWMPSPSVYLRFTDHLQHTTTKCSIRHLRFH